jgi:hypothetical protein
MSQLQLATLFPFTARYDIIQMWDFWWNRVYFQLLHYVATHSHTLSPEIQLVGCWLVRTLVVVSPCYCVPPHFHTWLKLFLISHHITTPVLAAALHLLHSQLPSWNLYVPLSFHNQTLTLKMVIAMFAEILGKLQQLIQVEVRKLI